MTKATLSGAVALLDSVERFFGEGGLVELEKPLSIMVVSGVVDRVATQEIS